MRMRALGPLNVSVVCLGTMTWGTWRLRVACSRSSLTPPLQATRTRRRRRTSSLTRLWRAEATLWTPLSCILCLPVRAKQAAFGELVHTHGAVRRSTAQLASAVSRAF